MKANTVYQKDAQRQDLGGGVSRRFRCTADKSKPRTVAMGDKVPASW